LSQGRKESGIPRNGSEKEGVLTHSEIQITCPATEMPKGNVKTPNTQNEVKVEIHYRKGTYYFLASDGRLVPVNRGGARLHLQVATGIFRHEAEKYLDGVKDYYVSHPAEALEIKKRYIREHAGSSMALTEDEVTEVALHGWGKYRQAYARRWRNGES
jgi:hypothetical protein